MEIINLKCMKLFLLIGLSVMTVAAVEEMIQGKKTDSYESCKRGRSLWTILYTINNELKPPFFTETQEMRIMCFRPFIRYMETAADKDRTFQFKATYYSNLGYFINGINGAVAEYFSPTNYTWWHFIAAPNSTLPVGVSSYYPKPGDHIIFNLTDIPGHS